jgi:hypothetical protein
MIVIAENENDLRKLITEVFRAEVSKFQLDASIKDEDQLMTIDEAAAFLKLSKQTLYAIKEVPAMKKGKRLYYSKNDLIKWLQTGRRKTTVEINNEIDRFLSNAKKKKR